MTTERKFDLLWIGAILLIVLMAFAAGRYGTSQSQGALLIQGVE
jgi:hypothetical protein